MTQEGITYDPMDSDTWTGEQGMLVTQVWTGLHNGNLQPLADYLRKGWYLPPEIASEIADAIDQKDVGYFHIVKKGRKPGQRGMNESFEDHGRKIKVGLFIHCRLQEVPRGEHDSVMLEAKEKFGLAPRTSRKYLRYFRQKFSEAKHNPKRDSLEVWKRVYGTP
ncbi:hypothetical protein GCM10023115_19350 [Pontixanthobacter gangjinensis]|uniref:Uncharacterized protein n=1 Tax=Pontixanthobacter gangjinensis TaxID=1028742 RepID=A0A6I4SN18_9SPHN|nr:hypothetical protein [Pontixanthobacter gangjinensis]MXO57185.1 hypothetical protein [Pontixanthobacter gangjinensis]